MYTRIAVSELKSWQDDGRQFDLLDVLPAPVYEARHLPGAVNACVFEVSFDEEAPKVLTSPQTPVVVYGEDNHTQDAKMAAEKLQRMGYTNIYLLIGGADAWRVDKQLFDGNQNMPADHALTLPEKTWTLDTEASSVEWTGRNANGKHVGTLKLSGGELRTFDRKLGGDFTVDMTSLTNSDLEDPSLATLLVKHLLSADFFFADQHPESRFTIEESEYLPGELGKVNFHVRGQLTLRGVQEIIAFPATVVNLDDTAIAAEAHFDLDRTRWGAIYGSGQFFKHLGIHLVWDTISIQVRLVAR